MLPASIAQTHIGVSSTVIDLGTIKRGSNNVATFHLVTTTSESFLVDLNKEPAAVDFFSREGYKDYLFNYSEENVMNWIKLFSSSVRIEVLSEEERTGIIGAQKEVKFIINVPEEAEPGYHIFRIKPIPVSTSDVTGQVGARVISLTTVTFLFNIEGKAVRDGLILDVVSNPISDNRFSTNTYFQNTGTTTITASASQTIYKDGEVVANAPSPKKRIKPSEIKVLKTSFPANKFSEGDYEVRTNVNFLTGSVSKNSTIHVSLAVLPPVEEKPKKPLWWIIVLIVIIVISFIIYKIS